MVYTSKCSVLINNSLSGFFSYTCGLCQGNPLPPYLLILAEEVLNLHIVQLRSSGKIVPISPIPSTPYHLLYADHILLFLKARKWGLRSVQVLLSKYQALLGNALTFRRATFSLVNVLQGDTKWYQRFFPSPGPLFPQLTLELLSSLAPLGTPTSISFWTPLELGLTDGKRNASPLRGDWLWLSMCYLLFLYTSP